MANIAAKSWRNYQYEFVEFYWQKYLAKSGKYIYIYIYIHGKVTLSVSKTMLIYPQKCGEIYRQIYPEK